MCFLKSQSKQQSKLSSVSNIESLMDEFKDKVIIVTGASSGIGKAVAEAFAEHQCYLALTGRNRENLKGIAATCKSKGARDVLTIIAEFEDLSQVEAIVDKTVTKFRSVHVLVNNAGLNLKGNLESVTMENFDKLFNVNVKSLVRITQQAMPHLVKTKGTVVNISSYCSVRQIPNLLIQCMAKAAVDQFTKTVALEYAPKGVRVNAVNPFVVRTNICRDRFSTAEELNEYFETCAQSVPLGRIGEAEDCAKSVLFLASKSSSWTTGQCILLDGARSLA